MMQSERPPHVPAPCKQSQLQRFACSSFLPHNMPSRASRLGLSFKRKTLLAQHRRTGRERTIWLQASAATTPVCVTAIVVTSHGEDTPRASEHTQHNQIHPPNPRVFRQNRLTLSRAKPSPAVSKARFSPCTDATGKRTLFAPRTPRATKILRHRPLRRRRGGCLPLPRCSPHPEQFIETRESTRQQKRRPEINEKRYRKHGVHGSPFESFRTRNE